MDLEATLENTLVQDGQPETGEGVDSTLIESAETTYAQISALCDQLTNESKDLSIKAKQRLTEATALMEEARGYDPRKVKVEKIIK